VRLYVAGPLFSEAERAWLDALASRLRAEGHDCFVPHENFTELADVTLERVFRVDAEGLRSANALVAWLDGPIVDDGTACEIGMFAELCRSGGAHYRGIVAVATDIRLERRRTADVVGGGMNLFVGGAIESCGRICHTVDEVVATLTELDRMPAGHLAAAGEQGVA
jgi:nucleoside 2-deoxyribosyltransferase-like protein